MRTVTIIPAFIKDLIRPVYEAVISSGVYRKIVHKPMSLENVHEYWKAPRDAGNYPQDYIEGEQRTRFLLELVSKYVDPSDTVLEIGCNVGRNLNGLFQAGFRNIEGIEINEKAVDTMRRTFPDMAATARIHNTPVEAVIRSFKESEFGLTFTMAVLEHIHSKSEWIFGEMVRITRDCIITIEDEKDIGDRHFPRTYSAVFEPLGMRQVESVRCTDIEGLGPGFFARVFKKI